MLKVIGLGSLGCLPFLIILGVSSIIGGFLWPYTINTWLVFVGKPESIVWWQGAILGVCPFFGQISIPVSIIT